MTRKTKGKEVRVLTLMTDPLRFPAADIVDIYGCRWEIEQGYREMKQSLLGNRLTLRSRTSDMVRQELWRTLLAYKLIYFQMARMAYSLDSIHPNQLSFHQAAHFIIEELSILPTVSPGRVPDVVIPARRERSYPRAVRARPQKYTVRKKASQA